jgi:phage terminase large subunit-like protein
MGDVDGDDKVNFCSPEMIMKYAEKLVQEEQKLNKFEEKPPKQKDDHASEKNMLKQQRRLYAVCGTFNPEVGILAVCMINREVKIFKIK